MLDRVGVSLFCITTHLKTQCFKTTTMYLLLVLRVHNLGGAQQAGLALNTCVCGQLTADGLTQGTVGRRDVSGWATCLSFPCRPAGAFPRGGRRFPKARMEACMASCDRGQDLHISSLAKARPKANSNFRAKRKGGSRSLWALPQTDTESELRKPNSVLLERKIKAKLNFPLKMP